MRWWRGKVLENSWWRCSPWHVEEKLIKFTTAYSEGWWWHHAAVQFTLASYLAACFCEPFTNDTICDLALRSHQPFTTVLYVIYLSLYMSPSPQMLRVIYRSVHTSSSLLMSSVYITKAQHGWLTYLFTRALHQSVIYVIYLSLNLSPSPRMPRVI